MKLYQNQNTLRVNHLNFIKALDKVLIRGLVENDIAELLTYQLIECAPGLPPVIVTSKTPSLLIPEFGLQLISLTTLIEAINSGVSGTTILKVSEHNKLSNTIIS